MRAVLGSRTECPAGCERADQAIEPQLAELLVDPDLGEHGAEPVDRIRIALLARLGAELDGDLGQLRSGDDRGVAIATLAIGPGHQRAVLGVDRVGAEAVEWRRRIADGLLDQLVA
jgi:hypothetical protein